MSLCTSGPNNDDANSDGDREMTMLTVMLMEKFFGQVDKMELV